MTIVELRRAGALFTGVLTLNKWPVPAETLPPAAGLLSMEPYDATKAPG